MENKDEIKVTSEKKPEVKITNEYEKSSLEYQYIQHFNLLKTEENFLSKKQILDSTLYIISKIDPQQTRIILKEKSTNLKKWEFDLSKDVLQRIISTIINDIQINLNEAKDFKITKIIDSLVEEENKLVLYTDYDFDFYDFDKDDKDDIQIKSIEEYLILKNNYKLDKEEIQSLSKKQKRYLLYKVKNNIK
jgi:hypothetical protein